MKTSKPHQVLRILGLPTMKASNMSRLKLASSLRRSKYCRCWLPERPVICEHLSGFPALCPMLTVLRHSDVKMVSSHLATRLLLSCTTGQWVIRWGVVLNQHSFKACKLVSHHLTIKTFLKRVIQSGELTQIIWQDKKKLC